MKETILQFGTGNFLRGFVDYFVDSMNKQGLYGGKIIVVSPTDSKTVSKINQQNGKYNLIIRGLENGNPICKRTETEAISRAVNPYASFEEYLHIAHNPDLRFVISNTTEAGIAFDEKCKLTDQPASSFPGKLTQLLYERYKAKLLGVTVFACELIDNNGQQLKKCVLEYARLWKLESEFIYWLENENTFCNTLVDRIVTGYPKDEAESIFLEIGYRDELLDTAEPYHLWAIEGDFEKDLPLQKAGFNVIWTNDIRPYKKMKVRILNGAHTALVFPSLLCGIETVGESLKDEQLNAFLHQCLFKYILPNLPDNDKAKDFAAAVLERFANPYIQHLWKSISLNSVSKFKARVLPTVNDCLNKNNAPKTLAFSLACLIEYYKNNNVSDEQSAVEYIKSNSIEAIIANTALWGQDLSCIYDIVGTSTERIHKDGIREALQWSML